VTNVRSTWGMRKVREGVVVSDKMEKTIVVAVQSNIRHKLYKKTIRRMKKYMAHDETEQAKLGDRVRIAEAAPTSKRKRWALVTVLTQADLPEVAPESIDLELLGEVKPEEEVAEIVPAGVEAAPVEAEVDTEAVASLETQAAPVEAEVESEAVASPEAEAAAPPESVAAPEEIPAVEEAQPVLMDAAPEALDTMADVDSAESVEPAEPEVPERDEADVVLEDAAPEATEPKSGEEEEAK
jgi:small subunit ribosomal protein S17